jgi:hypothetical protein
LGWQVSHSVIAVLLVNPEQLAHDPARVLTGSGSWRQELHVACLPGAGFLPGAFLPFLSAIWCAQGPAGSPLFSGRRQRRHSPRSWLQRVHSLSPRGIAPFLQLVQGWRRQPLPRGRGWHAWQSLEGSTRTGAIPRKDCRLLPAACLLPLEESINSVLYGYADDG